jgi:hypothetical protein
MKLTARCDPRIDWKAARETIDLAQVATALLGPAPGRRGERGRRLWWRCPFHEDRNSSFRVDPGRPWWRCFGCGEHGDAVALVRRLNPSMSFPEAVASLTDGPIRTRPGKAPGKPVARPATPPPTDRPRRTLWPSWKPPPPGSGPPRERMPWPT